MTIAKLAFGVAAICTMCLVAIIGVYDQSPGEGEYDRISDIPRLAECWTDGAHKIRVHVLEYRSSYTLRIYVRGMTTTQGMLALIERNRLNTARGSELRGVAGITDQAATLPDGFSKDLRFDGQNDLFIFGSLHGCDFGSPRRLAVRGAFSVTSGQFLLVFSR